MNKNKIKALSMRFMGFVLGQFLAATGVVLCVKSNLGVSAGAALPNVVNKIYAENGGGRFLFWDLTKLGDCTTVFLICLVLFQIVLLRRQFELRGFLQLFSSIIFGLFINLATLLFGGLDPQNYAAKAAVLIAGFIVQAIGIAIYVDTRLILMPPEGVIVALNKKFDLSLGKAKIAEDVTLVILALILSLLVLHRIEGIREGTVFLALAVGPVMGKIHNLIEKPLKKIYYPETATA